MQENLHTKKKMQEKKRVKITKKGSLTSYIFGPSFAQIFSPNLILPTKLNSCPTRVCGGRGGVATQGKGRSSSGPARAASGSAI